MRFRLQYQDGDRWRYVKGADSAGGSYARARAARSSPAGRSRSARSRARSTFRGRRALQWRRDGEVVRRAHRVTEAGHVSTGGADPEGYSAATCSMG